MLLALDIGGTRLTAARIDDGAIVERRQLPLPPTAAGLEPAIDELVDGWPQAHRVTVSTPGYVDAGRVYPVNRTILSYWKGYPLEALLRLRFDCPVQLMNDGQAAAWGEYMARAKSQPGNRGGDLLFMTLSAGVGGGMVLDHRLRIGLHALAGHVSHIRVRHVPVDGPVVCGCGRTGCLEAIASGTSLARQASAAFARPVDSQSLFRLAAEGEPRADALLDHAAAAVADAIAGLHMTLGLSDVVIGGSVGLAPGMLQRIGAALDARPLPTVPRLDAALLGSDAGLIGAASWRA